MSLLLAPGQRYYLSVDTGGYSITQFDEEEIVVASYTKGPDQSKHGPSWRDVAMIIKEVELLVGERPYWTTSVTATFNGLPSFQLMAIVNNKPLMAVGQSFVPASNTGPSTMPAAIYLLFTKVYHHLEAKLSE